MEVVLDSEQVKNLTLGTALLESILKINKNSKFKCDKEVLSLAIKKICLALEGDKIFEVDSLEKIYSEYSAEADRRLPNIQIKLHPLDENIFELPHLHLYMHDYPKEKPEKDKVYLTKSSNNNYALLHYSTSRDEFLRPYDTWISVKNVIGWLEFY